MEISGIAVRGLGLLGGSLCKAVRSGMPGCRIAGISGSVVTLQQALSSGDIDEGLSPEDILPEYVQLVFVAVPVRASVKIVADYLDDDQRTYLVCDVGSVKGALLDGLKDCKNLKRFVPSHPMAGSEKSGFGAARFDLYQNAPVILTPHEQNSSASIELLHGFWSKLGAKVLCADPWLHDKLVAYTSHLPHVMASLLAVAAGDGTAGHSIDARVSDFTGNGFRDTTRIAEGAADVWTDILLMNRNRVCEALDEMQSMTTLCKHILEQNNEDELRQLLKRGALARKGVLS